MADRTPRFSLQLRRTGTQRKDKKRQRLEKLCQASIEKSPLNGILGEF